MSVPTCLIHRMSYTYKKREGGGGGAGRGGTKGGGGMGRLGYVQEDGFSSHGHIPQHIYYFAEIYVVKINVMFLCVEK